MSPVQKVRLWNNSGISEVLFMTFLNCKNQANCYRRYPYPEKCNSLIEIIFTLVFVITWSATARANLSILDPASAIFLAALITSDVFFSGPLPLWNTIMNCLVFDFKTATWMTSYLITKTPFNYFVQYRLIKILVCYISSLTKCRTSNLIWWCLKHMSYTKCICIFKCPLSWHSFLTTQPLKSMLFSSQWLMLSLSSLEQNGTV